MSENYRLERQSQSRKRMIIYWVSTGILVMQTAVAAVLDLLREPGFAQVIQDLGYPLYLMTILGVCRILAIIALLVPRRHKLKEWTYAGLFFSFTGASASHFIMNNPIDAMYPIVFAIVLFVSYRFRPSAQAIGKEPR